jgi:hypothetical protein
MRRLPHYLKVYFPQQYLQKRKTGTGVQATMDNSRAAGAQGRALRAQRSFWRAAYGSTAVMSSMARLIATRYCTARTLALWAAS